MCAAGDLKYISYPLICEDGISSLGTIDTEKYEPTEKVISLFNIVVCVVRDSALAKLKLKESQLQTATASSSLEHVGADPIITALGLQNSFREIAPETLERAVKVYIYLSDVIFLHFCILIYKYLYVHSHRIFRWLYCLKKGGKGMLVSK